MHEYNTIFSYIIKRRWQHKFVTILRIEYGKNVIGTVTVHITDIFADILPLSTRNIKYKCVDRQVKNIEKVTATRWRKVFSHELKSSRVFKYEALDTSKQFKAIIICHTSDDVDKDLQSTMICSKWSNFTLPFAENLEGSNTSTKI
jgi:hypothetical protein